MDFAPLHHPELLGSGQHRQLGMAAVIPVSKIKPASACTHSPSNPLNRTCGTVSFFPISFTRQQRFKLRQTFHIERAACQLVHHSGKAFPGFFHLFSNSR